MENGKEQPTVDPKTAAGWRGWLDRNHDGAAGVWVVINKKGASPNGLTYEQAVDEAICYGWIDSRMHPATDVDYRLWFSPRQRNSIWSRTNKDRVERLAAGGRLCPAGEAAIAAAKANGSWNALDDIDNLVIPPDFQAALNADPAAAANFAAFSDSKKKIILRWFDTAKRPATRARRIAETIAHAAKNELPHH